MRRERLCRHMLCPLRSGYGESTHRAKLVLDVQRGRWVCPAEGCGYAEDATALEVRAAEMQSAQ